MLVIFKVDLRSATSFKRYRRELFIDVAQHTPILKSNQTTYYPRFSFTPKRGIELPETGVLFLHRNEPVSGSALLLSGWTGGIR